MKNDEWKYSSFEKQIGARKFLKNILQNVSEDLQPQHPIIILMNL